MNFLKCYKNLLLSYAFLGSALFDGRLCAVEQMQKFTQEVESEVKQLAEEMGIGNKAANLCVMQKYVSKFKPQSHIKITIPEFFAISSKKMMEILFGEENQNITPDTIKVKLAEISDEDGQKIVERLKAVEDVHCIKSNANVTFCDYLSLLKDEKIMVRSTGAEDKKDNANAGGNETVANVNPQNDLEIWQAIKVVLLSYYGAKSIAQQALARVEAKREK